MFTGSRWSHLNHAYMETRYAHLHAEQMALRADAPGPVLQRLRDSVSHQAAWKCGTRSWARDCSASKQGERTGRTNRKNERTSKKQHDVTFCCLVSSCPVRLLTTSRP